MGKMPLYTMLQKARSAGGWTMVAQFAQDIYTVKSPSGKEYMFPGVDAFLKERNPPEGYILVTPIPGLLDDDFDSEREEE